MATKAQAKSEAKIESDKWEVADLTQRILRATNTIPEKVLNSSSHQVAVAFKAAAAAARKAAEATQPRLSKLREAWTAIAPYYAQH
jgi:hypothetical protein